MNRQYTEMRESFHERIEVLNEQVGDSHEEISTFLRFGSL